ncbi:MAG: DUF6359 domain-containing protein [Bacteroidales bacterium]|nr:DUF6359 domain-containing protein [Bacteroidales bacterium]
MIKNIKNIIAMMLVAMVGLTSCDYEYAQPPVNVPEGGIGTGAWDNPMTAYQCLIGSVNEDYPEPWVTGYIVGVVNVDISNVISEQCAQFEGPFTVATNLIIAMNPEERNYENCATVQLPSGGARTALNLVDNPDNLGKQVTLKGTVGSKYCGAYGVRSVSDYNWGDKGKEEIVLPPVDGPFYQDFDFGKSFDTYAAQGWKNVEVSGGLSGWYIKEFSGNNYITTSAYLGTETGGPYENWLITPAIDMDKIAEKTLQFETQAAYPADNCTLEVYVMSSNNPKTSTSTQLKADIAVPPTGTSYSDWKKANVDLSAYSGTIYIGWRYYSEKGGSGFSTTYCIDNVNVGNAEKPDHSGDTPTDPSTPGSDQNAALYKLLASDSATCDWIFDNISLPEGVSYVWKWTSYNGTSYLNASAFVGGKANTAKSIAHSPAISLEGVTGASVDFQHAAKYQTTLPTIGKFVVRESGTTDWTEYDIPTWPDAGTWKFASSGKIDISRFDGKVVEVGFKYESTTEGADQWEINNLNVYGKK